MAKDDIATVNRSTNLVTGCANGELRAGDMVVSGVVTDYPEYSYLVGRVTEITKAGTPGHDGPEGVDTVIIDFSEADYSHNRIREIEERFGNLYDEAYEYDSGSFTFIQVPPEQLINVSRLPDAEFNALLWSEQGVADFCACVMGPADTRHNLPPDKGTGFLYAQTDDNNSGIIPNALHIQRDDSMLVFGSDKEAAEAAKKAGVPFVNVIEGFPGDVYVDTPENRGIIGEWLDRATQNVVSGLKQELVTRLNANLTGFVQRLASRDDGEMSYLTAKNITTAADVYQYLTQSHKFSVGELEYLLLFQEPLSVVIDVFDMEGNRDKGDVLRDECLSKSALRYGGYAREVLEEESLDGLSDRLRERLVENYNKFTDHWTTGRTAAEVFENAEKIVLIQDAFYYMTNSHDYKASEAEFLLQFQNPLEVISANWHFNSGDKQDTARQLFSAQEDILSKGGHALVTQPTVMKKAGGQDLPDKAASANAGRIKGIPDGYTSVLDHIRRDKEEKRTAEPAGKDAKEPGSKHKQDR